MGLARFCRGALVALLAAHAPAFAQTSPSPTTAPPAEGTARPDAAAPQGTPVPAPPAPQGTPAPQAPAPGAAAPVTTPPPGMFEDAIGYSSRQWRIERIDANHLRLVGQVEIRRQKLQFFADRVDIYNDRNLMVAEGNVVFVNEANRLSAERMEFDLKKQVGTFYEASGIATLSAKATRTTLGAAEAEVYFYGRKIEKIGPQKYRLTDGAFTTCVQPEPRWELVSGTVTLTVDHYAVARNMLLRVKGVPLLYLPAVYYPIKKEERATGFLMPTYGSSSLRGPSISNGFFWAMSRSRDVTVLHDWFSRTGQGLGAEYRYVGSAVASGGTARAYILNQKTATYQSGPGTTTTLPATRSYNLLADATQTLGGHLRARGHVDYFSSLTTQQLYQTNIYQATQQMRTVSGALAGTWGRYDANASYQRNETFSSSTQSFIYGFGPRVSGGIAPTRLFGIPLYGAVAADYSNALYKNVSGKTETDYGMRRFDLFPSLRAALSKWPFLTINSSAGARTTHYSKSRDPRGVAVDVPLTRRYAQFRSEIIGPVFVKIWDTPGSRTTERRKHVVEPSFGIDRVTNFPGFSRVLVLSDATDYIVPANTRLTYGVTNRFLSRARSTGTATGGSSEFLTIGVQQSYYTNRVASQYDTTYTSLYAGRPLRPLSPVAITARALVLASKVDANARVEYDIQGFGLTSVTTGGSVSSSSGSSGSLAYSWRRPLPTSPAQPYINGAATIRAHERRVGGQYSVAYDLQRGALVTHQIVAFYNAQCCGFGIEFQKYNYPTIDPRFPIPQDTRINFSITLAGLGAVSNFHGAMSAIPH